MLLKNENIFDVCSVCGARDLVARDFHHFLKGPIRTSASLRNGSSLSSFFTEIDDYEGKGNKSLFCIIYGLFFCAFRVLDT